MAMNVLEELIIGNAYVVGFGTNSKSNGLDNYSLMNFTLSKGLMAPNEFRFTLYLMKMERDNEVIHFDIANELLFQEVSCKFASYEDCDRSAKADHTLEFKGVVVSATMEGMAITCVARSKDIEMDRIPRCNYFIDNTLKEIVEFVWKGDKTNINPHYDKKIPYVVQYNETDYAFLSRLARQYGEFFYYEETQGLVFGKFPSFKKTENLVIVEDFCSVKYDLWSADPNFVYVAHHYPTDGLLHSDAKSFGEHLNPAKGTMFSKSVDASIKAASDNKLFYDYPYVLPVESPDAELQAMGDVYRNGLGSRLARCQCQTTRLDLHVGSLIKFQEKKTDNHSFVVISSYISWSSDGSMTNNVVGMSLPSDSTSPDLIYSPYVDATAYPKSNAQRAVVVDNVDPEKMGRVMVRFAWQDVVEENKEKNYPWIRIAQPYGGNQKGCYILPEIGEEVMVGFEHQNMEKPFVMGTLYHNSDKDEQKQMPEEGWCEVGGDGKKVNEENEVKAFRTKKGHTIEIHDTKEGDGFIRIYGNNNKDKENYDIILSTDKIQKVNGDNKEDYQFVSVDEQAEAGKDIKEKKDYKAEKLRILVRSNGGDIMLDAGEGDIIMNAKNIHVHATGNTTSFIEGKNIVKVNDAQLTDVGSNSLMVQKDQTIEIKGKETEKYDKEMSVEVAEAIKLKAKSLSSQTDQKTEVKASDVDVNANSSAKVKANSSMELDSGGSGKLHAANLSVEADASAKLKGATVSVEGSATTTVKSSGTMAIQTTQGSRSGLWNDQ